MTLKPAVLTSFLVHIESIDKLDIEMLIKCLHQGTHRPGGNGTSTMYRLDMHREDSYDKSSYEFLPKAFKYRISEYDFNNWLLGYDAFYHFSTDPITIKIDYCEEILKDYPSAKRPLKFYKKLKSLHPEYFV